MKIKPAQPDNSFKPIEITFVFESQDEMDALAALMNYSRVCDAVDTVVKTCDMPDIIREHLGRFGADSSRHHNQIRTAIEKRCKV